MSLLDSLPISLDYLQQQVSDVDMLERYLGYRVDFDSRFLNPFRNDKKPGCQFWRSSDGKVRFWDWSTKDNWDGLDVACQYYQCWREEAIQQVAQDFGLQQEGPLPLAAPERDLPPPILKTGYVPIQVKTKLYSEEDLKFWSLSDWTASPEQLKAGYIYSLTDYWWKGYVQTGLRRTYGYMLGWPDKWQIYRPFAQNRKYRFRQSSSEWVIGLTRLRKDGYVLITKSYKDYYYLRLSGFNVICVISESKKWTEEEIQKVADLGLINPGQRERLVFFYDNDETGVKWAAYYSELFGCSYLMTPSPDQKDYAAFAKQYGLTAATNMVWEQLSW